MNPRSELIQAKISLPPPRSHLIHRERLYARLAEGAQRKLTLLTAPAGFGKTTLLSGWIQQLDLPLAWYTLDVQDNDPDRFLAYLLAALEKVEPRLQLHEGAQALRQAQQPAESDTLLAFLANEIDQLDEALALVLDDFHVIHNPDVDSILSFLLEYLPASFRLLVASRNEPSFSVARLRANGQVLELTEQDLRFTSDEAAQFLQHTMGLQITPAQIAELEERTEGWIAGLQLAALSLEGQASVLLAQGKIRTLIRWIESIPDPVCSKRPLLQLPHAWARLLGDPVQFQAEIEH